MEGKMNKLLLLLFVFSLISCNRNSQMEIYKASTNLCEFDKKTIAEAYLNNVEYYRLHYPFEYETISWNTEDSTKQEEIEKQIDKHFQKYPKAKKDYVSFYKPSACRFSLKMNGYVSSPIPSKEQIFVSTDSIFYNKNATFCIAFLCVEEKFDELDGFEKEPHTFRAEAMVGFRKHSRDTLKMYPLTFFRLMGYDKKKTLVDDLIKIYTTRLKGTILPWSIYGENRFNHNVGEKGFFKESPLFMKYNDSTYCFQMYRNMSKDYPFDYPY